MGSDHGGSVESKRQKVWLVVKPVSGGSKAEPLNASRIVSIFAASADCQRKSTRGQPIGLSAVGAFNSKDSAGASLLEFHVTRRSK